jgi:asparaginyl-tRNA synthetase
MAAVRSLQPESGMTLRGEWHTEKGTKEFQVTQIVDIFPAVLTVVPPSKIAPEPHLTGEALNNYLTNRHLYIRSPYALAALKARHRVHNFLVDWLSDNDFTEISAPILTQLPLYDDSTAVSLKLHEQLLYLTQCVGYYLEAAVHGLNKVYNIGPSFRAEDSRSNRHLVEYWHIKVEATWFDRPAIMDFTERLICDVVAYARQYLGDFASQLETSIVDVPSRPFGHLTYREAAGRIQAAGLDFTFGDHIGPREERVFDSTTPYWIVGNPRSLEPFPYKIDPADHEVTMTADLIMPGGYGELLGVAEKITDQHELLQRMAEKGKDITGAHRWLVDIRNYGCVPHCGMGMGFERLLRWLFQTRHVREFAAFPRLFGRPYWP